MSEVALDRIFCPIGRKCDSASRPAPARVKVQALSDAPMLDSARFAPTASANASRLHILSYDLLFEATRAIRGPDSFDFIFLNQIIKKIKVRTTLVNGH